MCSCHPLSPGPSAIPVEKVFELTAAPYDIDSLRGRIDRRLTDYPELLALVKDCRIDGTLGHGPQQQIPELIQFPSFDCLVTEIVDQWLQ